MFTIESGPKMVRRERVVEAAREYLGVPFRHQGRGRHGLDCAGLLVLVCRELGLAQGFRDFAYDRRPDGRTIIETLRRNLDRKPPGAVIQAGDVVLLRLAQRQQTRHVYPCHVAIWNGQGGVIHALASRGEVCEHRVDPKWWGQVVECYEIPGVE